MHRDVMCRQRCEWWSFFDGTEVVIQRGFQQFQQLAKTVNSNACIIRSSTVQKFVHSYFEHSLHFRKMKPKFTSNFLCNNQHLSARLRTSMQWFVDFFISQDTPCHALAPCRWSQSASSSLAEGYRNRYQYCPGLYLLILIWLVKDGS